ncbi:MAG TPA: ABC transporter permease, partial [Magnetovibrio sp.]
MIPSIPQPRSFRALYGAYVLLFFVYLVLPLAVVAVFAFNDSMFPSLPWGGFTLDWFFSDTFPRLGLFNDNRLLQSIGTSFYIACWVTVLSVSVGVSNAFLFERRDFPFKNALYMVMLLPLVVPGVILGISILVFSSTIANWLENTFGLDVDFLRPSTFLVVLGQFSFIATIATLVIAARLRKFDTALEEAAQSLGASKLVAVWTVTIP